MGIGFAAGDSTGAPFTTLATRIVNVTAESLSSPSGYAGEVITYTATVLDDTAAKLPAAFIAKLKINGTNLTSNFAFGSAVYSQATGQLNIDFTVPTGTGSWTVTLSWLNQII